MLVFRRRLVRSILCTLLVVVFLVEAVPAQSSKRRLEFTVHVQGKTFPIDPFSELNRFDNVSKSVIQAKRGEVLVLRIVGVPMPGWHTYPLTKKSEQQEGKRPIVQLQGGNETFQLLYPIEESEPKWKHDKDLEISYLYHPDSFTWTLSVYVKPTAPAGQTIPLRLLIDAQVCSTQCVDERTEITIPVSIDAGEVVPLSAAMNDRLNVKEPEPTVVPLPSQAKAAKSVETAVASSGKANRERNSSSGSSSTGGKKGTATLYLAVVTAIVGGFLSLLTPCVFPMIPITVSFFLKQSETQRGSATLMALVYSGTIMLVMALGGLVLMETLTNVINHWLTNFIIGALFLYFALSLLGWYDITLPGWLQDLTASQEGKGGLVGAFFMALTFSIISFACVGPIYGGFIATAATQTGAEAQIRRVLSVFAFSGAFAFPFFLLAVFPGLLRTMPRAGSWMNSIKVVMGFLELAAVIKFVRTGELLLTGDGQFISYNLAMAGYTAASLACAMYLFGLYRLPHDHEVSEHIGVPRLLFACTFLSLGLYFMPGIFKMDPLEIPSRGKVYAWVDGFLLPDPDNEVTPSSAGSGSKSAPGSEANEQQPWLTSLDEALSKARAEKKLIFIDFTGISCTNCKVNERTIFPRADVQEAFSKLVLLKLYTDTVPAGKSQQPDAEGAKEFRKETFGSGGLPLYALIRPTADSFESVGVFNQEIGLINKGDVPSFIEFLNTR